jgi:septal ring factor EnvC (AmiA/AmiB activator)
MRKLVFTLALTMFFPQTEVLNRIRIDDLEKQITSLKARLDMDEDYQLKLYGILVKNAQNNSKIIQEIKKQREKMDDLENENYQLKDEIMKLRDKE